MKTSQDARERNNLKYAVKGGNIFLMNRYEKQLTDSEKLILNRIISLQKILLENFDNSSKKLGFKLERYKVAYDENLRFDPKELYTREDLKRHKELIRLENIKFKKVVL